MGTSDAGVRHPPASSILLLYTMSVVYFDNTHCLHFHSLRFRTFLIMHIRAVSVWCVRRCHSSSNVCVFAIFFNFHHCVLRFCHACIRCWRRWYRTCILLGPSLVHRTVRASFRTSFVTFGHLTPIITNIHAHTLHITLHGTWNTVFVAYLAFLIPFGDASFTIDVTFTAPESHVYLICIVCDAFRTTVVYLVCYCATFVRSCLCKFTVFVISLRCPYVHWRAIFHFAAVDCFISTPLPTFVTPYDTVPNFFTFYRAHRVVRLTDFITPFRGHFHVLVRWYSEGLATVRDVTFHFLICIRYLLRTTFCPHFGTWNTTLHSFWNTIPTR